VASWTIHSVETGLLSQATWAIEAAAGLGAPLTERLRAEGITVVDVPAML
jgi:transposase